MAAKFGQPLAPRGGNFQPLLLLSENAQRNLPSTTFGAWEFLESVTTTKPNPAILPLLAWLTWNTPGNLFPNEPVIRQTFHLVPPSHPPAYFSRRSRLDRLHDTPRVAAQAGSAAMRNANSESEPPKLPLTPA